MRRISLAAVLAAVALCAAPSGASAATQIGETFPPENGCSPDVTILQSGSAGNPYAASTDGVITQWSYHAGGTADDSPLKLKVARPEPGADFTMTFVDFTIVGESELRTPTVGVLNSFPTRIPVLAGDVIGIYLPEGGACARDSDAGYTSYFVESFEPRPGETDTYQRETRHIDVSAILEPDCDKDGLGDESQDGNVPCGKVCKGEPVTIVGTDANNEITGTPERDVISGLGGKDEIRGLAGKDLICGGTGKDTLRGSKGNDKLYGQKGKDRLAGGGGKDRCVGGKKDDTAKKCEVEKSI